MDRVSATRHAIKQALPDGIRVPVQVCQVWRCVEGNKNTASIPVAVGLGLKNNRLGESMSTLLWFAPSSRFVVIKVALNFGKSKKFCRFV